MRVVMAALLASLFFLGTAWALTIKDRYYQAENAYAALKKNPKHQKYRDKWLACIEKYKLVQRLDPDGPWAAAGFYKAGLLYLELYQRSRLGADQQEASIFFNALSRSIPIAVTHPNRATNFPDWENRSFLRIPRRRPSSLNTPTRPMTG